jgi:hypothetical protein
LSGGEKIQGQLQPTCDGICLVGGEKGFNEMQRVIELAPQTYFRVWLFQQMPKSRSEENNWCADYQIFVSAKDIYIQKDDSAKTAELAEE